MRPRSRIQTTGPNNGHQLRDYSKSSNRSEKPSPDLFGDGYVYGGYYSSKRKGIDMWSHNNPVPISSLINGTRTLKQIADFYRIK